MNFEELCCAEIDRTARQQLNCDLSVSGRLMLDFATTFKQLCHAEIDIVQPCTAEIDMTVRQKLKCAI
jgi:hypothetical protein